MGKTNMHARAGYGYYESQPHPRHSPEPLQRKLLHRRNLRRQRLRRSHRTRPHRNGRRRQQQHPPPIFLLRTLRPQTITRPRIRSTNTKSSTLGQRTRSTQRKHDRPGHRTQSNSRTRPLPHLLHAVPAPRLIPIPILNAQTQYPQTLTQSRRCARERSQLHSPSPTQPPSAATSPSTCSIPFILTSRRRTGFC